MDAGIGFLTLYPLLAFGLVAVAIPYARRHAKALGFVDAPDAPGGRKAHENRVPPVGGLVVVPVALLVSLLAGLSFEALWPLALGALLLVAAGVRDDACGLAPTVKFLLQGLAATILVVWGDSRIEDLGNLFGLGPIHFGRMGLAFSLFCVVLLINAVNMIDGLDGLAGGIVFIALFWFALASGLYGDSLPAGFIGIWMAAVAGFLVYNLRNPWRRKASVFLGDSGSMALGLMLAWLAIGLSQSGVPEPMIRPVAVAWILTVPVMDAFALFVSRLLRGRHPFEADRRHLHHRFVDAGVSPGWVTGMLLVFSFLCGAIGYGAGFLGVPEWILSAAWIVLVLANCAVAFYHRSFVAFVKARRSGSSQ